MPTKADLEATIATLEWEVGYLKEEFYELEQKVRHRVAFPPPQNPIITSWRNDESMIQEFRMESVGFHFRVADVMSMQLAMDFPQFVIEQAGDSWRQTGRVVARKFVEDVMERCNGEFKI